MKQINEARFVDFCLDWQMNITSKESLKKEFKSLGWAFEDFKKLAQAKNYWVTSMKFLH